MRKIFSFVMTLMVLMMISIPTVFAEGLSEELWNKKSSGLQGLFQEYQGTAPDLWVMIISQDPGSFYVEEMEINGKFHMSLQKYGKGNETAFTTIRFNSQYRLDGICIVNGNKTIYKCAE